MPTQVRVPPLEQPERLDKFLIRTFPQTSRAYWREHLLPSVRVDGNKPAKGQFLHGGETLLLARIPPEKKLPPQPNPEIKLKVLYEDPFLIAVDKPAGLPCYPLHEKETQTVVNGILARYPEQSEIDPESWEAGLLHRLDNETSGVLLFARSGEANEKFGALNREGKILKEYRAWVEGPVTENGLIRKPIAHHPKNKKKMVIPKDEKEIKKLKARPALTQFEVIKSGKKFSLLRVGIAKGSRHQIRIHLASLGHPVAGDTLYGGKILSDPRYLLHHYQVQLKHPFTGKVLTINAPLPKKFHPL